MWLVFFTLVLSLLLLDLGIFHRKAKAIGVNESLITSAFYIAMGLAFGCWVWYQLGSQAGSEYFTGFLVEKTLALDNIFVISLIFTYFAIPAQHQHRVLFWGILGVIVLRAIMIGVGAALVAEFAWVLYIFAAFLIATGIKMLLVEEQSPDIGANRFLRFIQNRFRVTPHLHEERFLVRLPNPQTGRAELWATPLLLALVFIEVVDLIFAVDSVPAIFAITTDPFIVYTSNIFAILGLRALYFALAAVIDRFRYLKHALALVLVFIGSKIFIADLMGWEKFPASISLGVTLALITSGVVYSIIRVRQQRFSHSKQSSTNGPKEAGC
ncbi:TerC family protein [Hyphomicrobium sp.]|uniref:TerC family protein n=1 Tax=Hyphomicrobium sp. TaxID=82 RepID=UPI002E35EEF7|nr:TerC family protein [Hyphomicrobium sp.]HEX2841413.1 TerC family protein [Hyphomicrobium sp.]